MPCALPIRSEEHTSELQSHDNLVCRLLLEKRKIPPAPTTPPHVRRPPHRHPTAPPPAADAANTECACAREAAPLGLRRLDPFFFNDTATTEICAHPLHDIVPI